MAERGVVNDEIGSQPVAVFWGAADTTDALDAGEISEAAAVGTGIAYDPVVDDRRLTFEKSGEDMFSDIETGSTWTILGNATGGALEGAQLEPLPHRNDLWFAWQAFVPEAEVRGLKRLTPPRPAPPPCGTNRPGWLASRGR